MLSKVYSVVMLVTAASALAATAYVGSANAAPADGFFMDANLGWGQSKIHEDFHTGAKPKYSGFVWNVNVGL